MSETRDQERVLQKAPAPGSEEAEHHELAVIGAAIIARLGQPPAEPDPLTFTETRAAKRLGVSPGFFKSYVLPELRVIRLGSRVLVPLAELERWIERKAARTVG